MQEGTTLAARARPGEAALPIQARGAQAVRAAEVGVVAAGGTAPSNRDQVGEAELQTRELPFVDEQAVS